MTPIKFAATLAALAIAHSAAAQDISGANPSAVDDSWHFPEYTMNDYNHVYEWEDAVHDTMLNPYVQALYADEVARGGFAGTLEEFADAFRRSQYAAGQVDYFCSTVCGTWMTGNEYAPWVMPPNY